MEAVEWSDDDEKMAEFCASEWRKNHPEIEQQATYERKLNAELVAWQHEAQLIMKEWDRRVGTAFPGWDLAAVQGVADWVGLSAVDDLQASFDVYRRAMVILDTAERTAAAEAEGTGASSPTDLISFDDIRILADKRLKTVRNCVPEWRKTSAEIQDPCRYSIVRPHIILKWPGKATAFPEDYDDMRKILTRKRAEKQHLQGAQ
jgi:hypothetical protein